MTVLAGARIVTSDGVLEQGWVEVVDERILRVEPGLPPADRTDVVELAGGWLVPGFIDIHCHGGGGHDFTKSAEAMAAGVEFHLSHGTTRSVVSLMTAPIDALCEQLSWVKPLIQRGDKGRGRILGAHLEGPFLSHLRCGAQNPHHVAEADRQLLAKLLEAGQGAVRHVTIAPELPGALELVRDLLEADVIAAVGHTDAEYAQAAAAFEAGASHLTHAFNAMRAMNHRAPGPVPAAFDAGATIELINDGVHVHDAVSRLLARSAGSTMVFITDAISATGVGDGSYELGDQAVVVRDGEARLPGTGHLAGSTLTMDEAFRRAVVELGLSPQAAVEAASTTPARVLGISDACGAIKPGLDADFVLLDEELRLRKVMLAGQWRR